MPTLTAVVLGVLAGIGLAGVGLLASTEAALVAAAVSVAVWVAMRRTRWEQLR